jgi:hypothetical protein
VTINPIDCLTFVEKSADNKPLSSIKIVNNNPNKFILFKVSFIYGSKNI